ncbi:unnamed protein product, partial [Rotaria magnacalcarata]
MEGKKQSFISSHFLLYSTAVKILHAPESVDEINLAEQVMNYYCKTAPLVHGPSIELYSLHAHIHLAQQEIKWLDGRLGPYHTVLTEQLAAHTPDLNSCNFY